MKWKRMALTIIWRWSSRRTSTTTRVGCWSIRMRRRALISRCRSGRVELQQRSVRNGRARRQWHYYAFVINTEAPAETEITPYVDGQPSRTRSWSPSTGAGNFADSTLYWMSRDASTLFGAGSMQDLALYDTTLSVEHDLEHYEVGERRPKAAFSSSPVVATAGVPVRFDASGSSSPAGSIADYAWDFDGSKSYSSDGGESPTISHTFSSPGTYTVDLRVKDSLGETATVSHTITVGAALGQYEQAVEETSGMAHFWPMDESSGSSFADVIGRRQRGDRGRRDAGRTGWAGRRSSTVGGVRWLLGCGAGEVDLSGTHKLTVEFWMKWSALARRRSSGVGVHAELQRIPGRVPGRSGCDARARISRCRRQSATARNNNVFFERPSAEQWHYYAFVINTEAPAETEITPYVDGHAVSYTQV